MEKLKEIWKNLDNKWKYLISVFIVAIITIVSVLSLKVDTFQPLYTNLEQSELNTITQELSMMGVEYQFNAETGTITIDATQIPSVRMKLAGKGLPTSGKPGFELFDTNSLGATKFDKSVKYSRALIGDIQNTIIRGIDGVERTEVRLPLIEESSIFEEKKEMKATVILGFRSGVQLDASQIKGIQHIVSGSVKDLKPEDVVVLDEKGTMISEFEEGNFNIGSGFGKQLEIINETEKRLKTDIMKSLSTIFGYDHVRVNVKAEINFDEIIRNIERYDPEGTIVSRHEKRESNRQVDGQLNQEPGTDNNGDVPDYEIDEEGNATLSEQDKEELIENFEVGKTIETIKENPELTNMNVVVWIDRNTMSEQEINRIKKAIAVSAGIKDANNDGIFENGEVEIIPFPFKKVENDVKEDTQKENTQWDVFQNTKQNITYMIVIVMAILVLAVLFTWLSIRNRGNNQLIKETNSSTNKEKTTVSTNQNSNINENIEEGINEDDMEAQVKEYKEKKFVEAKNGGAFSEFEVSEIQKTLADEGLNAGEEHPKRTAEYIRKLINE